MIRAASTKIWASAILFVIFCIACCQLSNGFTLLADLRAPPNRGSKVGRGPRRKVREYLNIINRGSCSLELSRYVFAYPAFSNSIQPLRHGNEVRIRIAGEGTKNWL